MLSRKEECLICSYPPDTRDKKHLPKKVDPETGVYVCTECVQRAQSVTHFNLTTHELGQAVVKYLDLGY